VANIWAKNGRNLQKPYSSWVLACCQFQVSGESFLTYCSQNKVENFIKFRAVSVAQAILMKVDSFQATKTWIGKMKLVIKDSSLS